MQRMNRKREWIKLVLMGAVFLGCYYLPVDRLRLPGPIAESIGLTSWYAREHVLLCLIPAFFIAGGISVFVSQTSVMKYLGPGANRVLAYGVASVSGSILAVCSCTVLPLFAGIYRMGAGLGPATAFLYSGPAINVLAIILTAGVLGLEIGVARAVGAIVFSVVLGLVMHWVYRKEEREKTAVQPVVPEMASARALWQNAGFFAAMVGILVFANWSRGNPSIGVWGAIYVYKWIITGAFALVLVGIIAAWFKRTELREWCAATWGFAKQILPLLLIGVLVAGLLLGRPEGKGLIPNEWITRAVGGNSLRANLFASFAGALMYFATLTEVPIVQGLLASGMGKGPALALLLAGPALSLPNMLVIRSVIGTQKTCIYVLLVVIMATISGVIFGAVCP
jgi:uncharacterized membrane protein YraQ (UPF0718 family)